ncbi:hypothetical protein E4U17_007415 [Claviceps sp. LM77 group G4]|nr:hypothetical protein E4U17_007415 [Claviceps sp. LM77 group G4]KAG6057542.1 hypothetical protein E4U33_007483 [Claviceps sp. LM78 group G4]KAG6069911.1 hypothetical protein E4U16_007277 [Claviceps sp. LM84 group G4]
MRSPEDTIPPAQDKLDCRLAMLSFDDDRDQQLPILKLAFGQDELENAPHRRIHGKSKPLRIDACPDTRSVDLSSAQAQRDTPEDSTLRLGKHQSQQTLGSEHLATDSTDCIPQEAEMVSLSADYPPSTTGSDMAAAAVAHNTASGTDALLESLGWLEESEDLDLKLALDDFNFDDGDENVAVSTKWDHLFGKHLSVAKLPFGHRASVAMHRPPIKKGSVRTSVAASPHTSIPSSPGHGHFRRRSRALSLITPNRQTVPDSTTFVDPAAAHYQDPDARMKLRVYLASANKFDEAVEFGFPSLEDASDKVHASGRKRAASQEERSSSRMGKLPPCAQDDEFPNYSDDDEASTMEPNSPRTPSTIIDNALLMKPMQATWDETRQSQGCKEDTAHAPATLREMTLRMTLTRPDLRANEEQMYGWQKMSAEQKPYHIRNVHEPRLAASQVRRVHTKPSIERQLAAMDQEGSWANDEGVMKRLWNRVRRA